MLERIIHFLGPYLSAPWGYLVVGLAVFLENSIGAGVVVPGETLVILGGFYARFGEPPLLLPLVTLVVVVFAVLGDNVGYAIGRRYGRGILERVGPRVGLSPGKLAVAERYYESHGGKTVFLGRFIPVVRSVGFILAGAAGLPWRRFIVYDVAGAVIWGTGHTVLGYLIGATYKTWEPYLTRFGLALGALLVAYIVWHRRRDKRREAAALAEIERTHEA
ncbi:MAG: DedA family protein [Actinomycetota bacterium]